MTTGGAVTGGRVATGTVTGGAVTGGAVTGGAVITGVVSGAGGTGLLEPTIGVNKRPKSKKSEPYKSLNQTSTRKLDGAPKHRQGMLTA